MQQRYTIRKHSIYWKKVCDNKLRSVNVGKNYLQYWPVVLKSQRDFKLSDSVHLQQCSLFKTNIASTKRWQAAYTLGYQLEAACCYGKRCSRDNNIQVSVVDIFFWKNFLKTSVISLITCGVCSGDIVISVNEFPSSS